MFGRVCENCYDIALAWLAGKRSEAVAIIPQYRRYYWRCGSLLIKLLDVLV